MSDENKTTRNGGKNHGGVPHQIAAIGEVLWDVFPSGPRFGGAPANFACSLAALGRDRANLFMVSAVGKDDLGAAAMATLQDHHVDTTCVSELDFVTGQVLVEIDAAGCASYSFAANTAWDNLIPLEASQQLATNLDAVCFGSLGQRSDKSKATIRHFLSATQPAALRVFDINLRAPFFSDEVILESLEIANVLKLNDEELPVLAQLCQLHGSDLAMLRQLADRYQLRVVALTRGSAGAVLVRGDQVDECPGVATDVVDTVGAGDAFTATLALGLLENQNIDVINRCACEVAAFVCSQPRRDATDSGSFRPRADRGITNSRVVFIHAEPVISLRWLRFTPGMGLASRLRISPTVMTAAGRGRNMRTIR